MENDTCYDNTPLLPCDCTGKCEGKVCDRWERCNASGKYPANWDFTAVPLKTLKKGDWFTIKPIAYPKENQVYIKDDYDRSTKKYSCGRYDDIGYSREFSGTKLVYTDFIF